MDVSSSKHPRDARSDSVTSAGHVLRDSAYFAWPPRLSHVDNAEWQSVPLEHGGPRAPSLSASDIQRATKGRLTKLPDKRARPPSIAKGRGKIHHHLPEDEPLKPGPWESVVFPERAALARTHLPVAWDTSRGATGPASLSPQSAAGRSWRSVEAVKPMPPIPDRSSISVVSLETDSCPAPLIYPPVSEDDQLRTQLAAYQSFIIAGETSWQWVYYHSLPSRIGHEPCLDATCRAYLAAAQCRAGTPGVSLRTCYAALSKAIGLLQANIQAQQPAGGVRDTVIQSIALLAALEVTKGAHNILNPSHIEGLVSTLASRATGEVTDVSRSILNYFSCAAMTASIAKGAASPLEALDATHYRPEPSDPANEAVIKLNALRIELCIRLPRLVALTRAVRVAESGASTPLAIEMLSDRAFALAEELYHVRDDVAEHALRTDVECPGTVFFRKRHFTFSSPVAWETVSMYWHVRFLVLRLCLALLTTSAAGASALADLYPNSEGFLYQGNRVFSRAALEAETIRTGQNLLMSENLDRHNRPRRHRLRAQSFIVLWGALRGLPQIDIEHEPGPGAADRASTLRDRMLEYTVRALRAPELFFTEADMDDAAEMIVGGPVRGSYAKLYGVNKFWGG
ncbi:hypothetical protein LTR53_016260 [Teratosphaeriaceae sp. CCFEE 6253]|nr:hypothetical protein LTR53_016260 [Teratosphaeriaceae sp. CCFEE 6253]